MALKQERRFHVLKAETQNEMNSSEIISICEILFQKQGKGTFQSSPEPSKIY